MHAKKISKFIPSLLRTASELCGLGERARLLFQRIEVRSVGEDLYLNARAPAPAEASLREDDAQLRIFLLR